jgi:hypothetical protein
MSKRFTDTLKYHKSFIRNLPGAYKLLWDFIICECDHAGIWIVDFEIAQIYLGQDMLVNKNDALRLFNSDEKRIIEIDSNKKWFIPSFIDFQYGKLNPENRAHNSVIILLSKYGLIKNKELISPLQGAKDKEQDKDMDKDILKNKEAAFKNEVLAFKKYPIQTLNDFILYWTESNKSKTRLRYELEKTWDTSRRLAKWAANESKFSKAQIKEQPVRTSKNWNQIINDDKRIGSPKSIAELLNKTP